jgi:hypothetical protein
VLRVGSDREVRTRVVAGNAGVATTAERVSSRIEFLRRGQVQRWAKVVVDPLDVAKSVVRRNGRRGVRRWVGAASKGVTRLKVVVPIRDRHRVVGCVVRRLVAAVIIATKARSIVPRILT